MITNQSKKHLAYLGILLLATSCVTQQKYDELATEKVKADHMGQQYQADLLATQAELDELKKNYDQSEQQRKEAEAGLAASQENANQLEIELEELNTIYTNLLNNSGRLNRDLEAKQQRLENLSQELDDKRQENEALAADLRQREARVSELEQVIADKEAATDALRQKVSQALLSFAESDLTVEVRNGKVYVSLSEDLLFQSGSASVDPKGVDALRKLAGVLLDNQDISITVEGHTDDVPLGRSSTYLKDNWDLSVLRATSIVRILTNAGVPPSNVIASGRGEFIPVASNETPEGRANNRRTEIILTPKLDELFSILESN
ncbi:MAG TPA: hypothetical protein DCE41_25515 [Cytophagales bacterium]|nr:hypothetical protein [Cytophagales bacterium]HAP59118.1 hypothetical protein [Cytophagales bacterium]